MEHSTTPRETAAPWIKNAPTHLSTQSRELVIIDPHVHQSLFLAAGVSPDSEIIILNPHREGIQQITEILQGTLASLVPREKAPLPRQHSGGLSLHIISHGAPGTLKLGNSTLELNNLHQHRPQLQNAIVGFHFVLPNPRLRGGRLYFCHGRKGWDFRRCTITR